MPGAKGPKFLRFCLPILDALKALGSSGSASEVTDSVIEKLEIPTSEQEELLKSGQPKIRNQIAWARFYLVKGGLVDSSTHGVWSLTEKGAGAVLDSDGVYRLFKEVHARLDKGSRKKKAESNAASSGGETASDEEADADAIAGAQDYRTELLSVLKSLSPDGFERICQRLLRESGFQQVAVTGKSGDGGIDGHGLFELNPVVTFKVLFQCKRYTDKAVSAGQVRDFRGAMMGRADKGLIITTSSFTVEAKKEARRDGVPPIEMVDGEKLVEMFERAELGLRPRRTYELEEDFFDDYK